MDEPWFEHGTFCKSCCTWTNKANCETDILPLNYPPMGSCWKFVLGDKLIRGKRDLKRGPLWVWDLELLVAVTA